MADQRPPGDEWRPKLVVCDIDGTLLRWTADPADADEQVTARVRAALDAVRAAGVPIVLASGRAAYSMATIADDAGLTEQLDEPLWMVASNGAVVFRHPPVEVVHETTFDARDAVAEVLQELPEALVAVEEHGVGYRVNKPFPPGELSGEQIVTTVDQMVADEVSRVIIRDPRSTPEVFVELADRLGLHGTNYFIGWTAWLDLAPLGVDKSTALAYVCEQLQVDPADVLALGDGRNDLEMLRWAGRGVAMGQAVDLVHQAADTSTASVDDDGAAQELELWFG